MIAFEDALSRLHGVRRRGDDQASALCPAHDDSSPSLSLAKKRDGSALLKCHAGCTYESILRALGHDGHGHARNGGAGRHAAPLTREVCTYDYTDAAGKLLYQVVRFEPKGFRCRRPDGRSGWIWDLHGIQLVPYRLRDLAEADRVFVVEGEKDCDALAALGLVATCNHGGAGKWREEHTAALVAAAVPEAIILPDNDAPGEEHAASVAASLVAGGLRVKVVRLPGLPPKGDVSDWLAEGHQVDELKQLATDVPLAGAGRVGVEPLGVGAGDFLRTVYPPREAYIEGVLSNDGGGWVGGEEKLAKTFYCLDEALALVFGLPVCGRFAVPKRRRVFFLEEEDSPQRTQHRLNALLAGRGFTPGDPGVLAELNAWLRLSVWAGFKFDKAEMVERLEATIATFEPAVVYVDVLRKVTLRDLNKQVEASGLLDMIDDLRRKYGVLFRIIHHYRKSQGFRVGRGSQEIGGSYVFGAWGENSLFFEPVGRKPGAPVKVTIQSKDGAPEPPFLLRLEAEGPRHAPTLLRLHADAEKTEDDIDDLVIQAIEALPKTEALSGKPGVPRELLVKTLKKGDSTLRRILKRLLESGKILVTGKAAKGKELYGV